MEIVSNQTVIQNLIFTVRGMQVMLDSHLAGIYGVESKRLNEQVKRNSDRFPESFRFQLSSEEWNTIRLQIEALDSGNPIRSQIATLENTRGKHRKYLPYVFTEQGVAMLSSVLRSPTAIKVSIQIMNAFVELRKIMLGNAALYLRLDKVELKQLEADQKFDQIFKALESKTTNPEFGVFFDGQVYDAYSFVSELIRKAGSSIILIDNYIDDRVLTLLAKRQPNVSASVYTRHISKSLELDIAKHNQQYAPIKIRQLTESHDRFLIIDRNELYHIGASLKDLGKKWFAFSRIDAILPQILEKLD